MTSAPLTQPAITSLSLMSINSLSSLMPSEQTHLALCVKNASVFHFPFSPLKTFFLAYLTVYVFVLAAESHDCTA